MRCGLSVKQAALSMRLLQLKMRGEPVSYIEFLDTVAESTAARVKAKDKVHEGRWLKRGGVGVFMMLAHKWDRIESQVANDRMVQIIDLGGGRAKTIAQYNILEHVTTGGHPGGLLDDIRDLAGYLLLLEAELLASGVVSGLEGQQ